MATEERKFIKIKKVPLLNKRIILKKDIITGNISGLLKKTANIKFIQPSFKEDVIYQSDKCEFLQGDYQNVRIVNRLYHVSNTSKTIAKCMNKDGSVSERTSDELVKLIGQSNYDVAFSSLCSVINQELKVRGIFSLLTVPKKITTVSCQTHTEESPEVITRIVKDTIKPRAKRKRQALTPYVVKDEPDSVKKLVIHLEEFQNILNNCETKRVSQGYLPELGKVFDENSNDSIGNLSALSVTTTPELLKDPSKLLDNVDKHTKKISNLEDTESVSLDNQSKISTSNCTSPTSENKLLLRSQDLLSKMVPEQRMKFILQQAATDWKYCLKRNEDGYLPIHIAVLDNDVDLLRRQCIILKIKNESVDIPAAGNLTALKMSLYQDNAATTAMLLHFGADPLATDEYHRTPFHIAAESEGDHLQALVNYCRRNPRRILIDEELWRLEYEKKSDEELAGYLFNHICKLYDEQGYTPLMLASKMGKYGNVRLLAQIAPSTINVQAPNSGNTALYLAVGAAGMDSIENCNKTKVSDHFKNTIEILLENGSDPHIANFSNASVNDLVSEFTCGDLSMLIANKLTSVNFPKEEDSRVKKSDPFILIKEKNGSINIEEINKTDKNKPIIVANELLYPGTSDGKRRGKGQSEKKVNTDGGVVRNFKLNEPLIIRKKINKNKRKLEITIDSDSKSKKITKNT